MGFWAKLTIVILIALSVLYIKSSFFDGNNTNNLNKGTEKKLAKEETIQEPPSVLPEEVKENKAEVKEQKYVTVYFLGTDGHGNSLFKKAKREISSDSSQLKAALEELIQGPSSYEKKQGVYSEIPKSTRVLSVVEDKRIIINMSSDLVKGGGADSLYSRVKQVIKTALANSPKKPVYLYIDGKQADVIGGEGIMLTQPLSENSLDE